jgi:hypothetical protein
MGPSHDWHIANCLVPEDCGTAIRLCPQLAPCPGLTDFSLAILNAKNMNRFAYNEMLQPPGVTDFSIPTPFWRVAHQRRGALGLVACLAMMRLHQNPAVILVVRQATSSLSKS